MDLILINHYIYLQDSEPFEIGLFGFHNMMFMIIKLCFPKQSPIASECRNYARFYNDGFISELQPWTYYFENFGYFAKFSFHQK